MEAAETSIAKDRFDFWAENCNSFSDFPALYIAFKYHSAKDIQICVTAAMTPRKRKELGYYYKWAGKQVN